MGLDGGSFPLRIELVKTKQKTEVADKAQQRENQFFTCSLSGLPLVAPLVACAAGRLYSKESLLTALLAKRVLPVGLSHIRGLGDVFALRPHRNPLYALPASEPVNPDPVSPWTCPVTGREVGKSHERFVAMRGCGCVLALSVVQLQPDSQSCLNCGEKIIGEPVELCPPEEIAAVIAARLTAESEAKRGEKKKKKKKKTGNVAEREVGAEAGREEKRKKAKVETAVPLSVEAERTAKEKTSRVAGLFTAADKRAPDNTKMFMGISK